MKKFKRRANGSLSVTKLSGNRAKPFAVRETVKIDFKQHQKYIGYFETREEALDFINLYTLMKKKKINQEQASHINNSLTDLVLNAINPEMLTFKEIFNIIYDEKYKYQKNHKSVVSWFNKFNAVHDVKINKINLQMLQDIFEEVKSSGKGKGTTSHMKCVAMDIFEYAVKHQYISRNDDYTSYIDLSSKKYRTSDNKEKTSRKAFTVEEVRQIMKMNTIESKYALLFIFTGCRPNELIEIDTSKIYIDVECNDDGNKQIISYMITGSKTYAGLNRIIPIHDYIKPIIVELLKEHSDSLIATNTTSKVTEHQYNYFKPLMKKMNLDRVPYACRHTFSTLAKLYKVDEFARKRILGHKSGDLTDDVYTDTFINFLYQEINKISL